MARIGAELTTAQERGEIAERNEPVSQYVRAPDIPQKPTLPDIGIPRQRAADPRTIRRALATLNRLPNEALADLAERIIDRLDAAGPDADLEPEEDCCRAGDDGNPNPRSWQLGVGDETDAEESGDEHEPDDEDYEHGSEDEPLFPTLRAERDGLVTVHRRRHEFVLVTSKGGRPVRVRTVFAKRR